MEPGSDRLVLRVWMLGLIGVALVALILVLLLIFDSRNIHWFHSTAVAPKNAKTNVNTGHPSVYIGTNK